MILGTLRGQLLYPVMHAEIPDEELSRILIQVNLPDLVERCGGYDVELDFAKVLSIGEQQRLGVARILLSKPRYAVLDEATSALDSENEERLYLRPKDSPNTLVSVAHRQTLLKYHANVLEIGNAGSWRLIQASRYRFID